MLLRLIDILSLTHQIVNSVGSLIDHLHCIVEIVWLLIELEAALGMD